MSDQEKADLRNKQAQTDQIYINALVLSPEEIAVSRFGGEGYSLETVLNEEAREELAEEKEARDAAEEAALEQGKPGVERPGAEEVPK